jgi:hypothetical protein
VIWDLVCDLEFGTWDLGLGTWNLVFAETHYSSPKKNKGYPGFNQVIPCCIGW